MTWSRRGERQLERHAGDHQRGEAERDVHVEDPAPVGVVDEQPADERAEHRRDGVHAHHVALVLAAFARRQHVAHDRHREREDAAGADTLEEAGGDEHAHRGGGTAEDAAGHEDDDRELVEPAPAEEVAELAPERCGRRRGEQVAGEHPRDLLQAAEVRDDRRRGGRDDGALDRRDELREQEPRDAAPGCVDA